MRLYLRIFEYMIVYDNIFQYSIVIISFAIIIMIEARPTTRSSQGLQPCTGSTDSGGRPFVVATVIRAVAYTP